MIKDIKITKCVINERKEMVVNFICQQEDYTEVELELLRQAKIRGDLLDISFEGLTQGNQTEERKKKLQVLDLSMRQYYDSFVKGTKWYKGEDGGYELWKTRYINNTYGFKSRKQLSDTNLDKEIEQFKIANINNQP